MSQSEGGVRAAPIRGGGGPPNDPLPIHRFSKLRTRRALEGGSSRAVCKIQLTKVTCECVLHFTNSTHHRLEHGILHVR